MIDKKVKILVVDDSDIIRRTLAKFFEEYVVEVISCLDGLEGIQKALQHTPDLIFLDLMMPNLDGVKMLKVIKVIDDLKNVPVIVISGNTNKSNVLLAMESGADKVIPKPLQKETIINSVNEVLGNELLKNSKRTNLTEQENKEILNHLSRIFMEHYPVKKLKIEKALETKNKDLLSELIHEMKGAGGTIGYPIISVICRDIEKTIELTIIDWSYVKAKSEQIFSIVEKIESSKSILEK